MSLKYRRIAIALDLAWPYKRHADVFAGVQRYAASRGWQSIMDEFAHHTLGKSGKAAPYDGVIARASQDLTRAVARRKVPMVNVWPGSVAWHRFPGVYPDCTDAGRLCVEHLQARGFRAFATITSSFNRTEELLVAEMQRLADAAGFPMWSVAIPQRPEQDLAHYRETEAIIARGMREWTTPVGVYVGQETVGRKVVQMCHDRGWRVPADVAIIAGQNQETLCEYPHPALTSIEMGYERVGYEAARLLDRLMDGEEPPPGPVFLPPKGLVVRESTDFFAVDDKVVAAALAFISANSHRRIGPDDVAAATGAETRTLQNYFRRVLDRPIATEIRRVRIERAKRELVQSGRPLAEIARDAGFGSIQRLYEVFLREVGQPPSEYRQQRRMNTPK